ncbi:hypothetical protein KCH_60270 [Kitasatospora cheerisanensis KCTC 2395]|uniref:Uncharacterized protein n=1 Tax=Kitasatospora cheerisanensis KCTC 2395 TaxID=1348663 RepID=A0A066YL77_9ACTN|nr:hypothetical protein KCH_60270 [Kitasatospora cheerisanensis KCTC 2395]
MRIHSANVPFNDTRDESKVCKFYLDAFNFETAQLVSWEVDQQPPTGSAKVLTGSITLAGGLGHTNNLSLPNGSYKLVWNFVGATAPAKQRSFTVDCGTGAPAARRPPRTSGPRTCRSAASRPVRAAPRTG